MRKGLFHEIKASSRTAKSFGAAILFFALFVAFQNCSQTALHYEAPPSVVAGVPSLKLESHVCSQARLTDGQPTKFVFIMDLSASNFGGWRYETVGGVRLPYWDPTLATDPQGARFDAVTYFLDNCGNQTGSQFAFIGFSNSAGVLSNGSFSCSGVGFGTRDQTLAAMNALRARQTADEQWYRQWMTTYVTQQPPDSLIYAATSYSSASQCLETLITRDLTSPTSLTDAYKIFFMSDGVPEDKKGTGCNLTTYTAEQKQKCYIDTNLSSITMARTSAMAKGKDLRIQGIFYGKDTTVPVVLNAISQEGGTPGSVQLQSFSSQPSALCSLVVNQSGVGFQPDVYMAINLNVRSIRGSLYADSDADGLTDEQESQLGYDPQNPRSAVPGVLDGICEKFGGPAGCQNRRNQVVCSPSTSNGMALTNCDVKMLGLDTLSGVIDAGADGDKDGIADFVEIVKGTDPTRADASQDPDGDRLTTREELLNGSDPFYPDQDTLSVLLNKSKMTFVPADVSKVCVDGDWTLAIEQLQTIRTLPVQIPGATDLSHGKDEQMVAVIYRLTPTNSLDPQIEYYHRFVKVAATGYVGAEILTATPDTLNPSDFTLSGKVRP